MLLVRGLAFSFCKEQNINACKKKYINPSRRGAGTIESVLSMTKQTPRLILGATLFEKIR